MARVRIYSPINGGTKLQLFIDPDEFSEASDQAILAELVEVQSSSDLIRARLAICGGFPDLQSFDADLEDREFEVRDRLDYYAYQTAVASITAADHSWFTPDAVEAFCGETGTNIVGNSIDGLNNTVWRHNVDERHSVTYRLRDYTKRVTRIRFRYQGTELNREQLENLDIRMARNLNRIDDPGNLREQGLNPVWPVGAGNTWVEVALSSPVSQARYIKLEFDSLPASNDAQIREFAVRVETRAP